MGGETSGVSAHLERREDTVSRVSNHKTLVILHHLRKLLQILYIAFSEGTATTIVIVHYISALLKL